MELAGLLLQAWVGLSGSRRSQARDQSIRRVASCHRTSPPPLSGWFSWNPPALPPRYRPPTWQVLAPFLPADLGFLQSASAAPRLLPEIQNRCWSAENSMEAAEPHPSAKPERTAFHCLDAAPSLNLARNQAQRRVCSRAPTPEDSLYSPPSAGLRWKHLERVGPSLPSLRTAPPRHRSQLMQPWPLESRDPSTSDEE